MTDPARPARYDAVLFDLLTALVDSWTLWNDVAGGADAGLAWRRAYLEITYGCGAYRPYEDLVAEAAVAAGLPPDRSGALTARWGELAPWPEAPAVLDALAGRVRLGVVTNCSSALGRAAADLVRADFDAVSTAEAAGFYKPRPEPYRHALDMLGAAPERTLFVAGSAADVPGAADAGMTVYWHNRISLPARGDVRPAFHERSLDRLAALI